jgi:hypothetical protein
MRIAARASIVTALGACACPQPPPDGSWQLLRNNDRAAFTSVRGLDSTVWIVGGDPDGPAGPATAALFVSELEAQSSSTEPTILQAIESGVQGDLWWVEPVSRDVAFVGGSSARVLRVDRSSDPATLTPAVTPRTGDDDPDMIVFGIYASSAEDIWAVGGRTGGTSGAFAWHSVSGGPFTDEPLGTTTDDHALWKVEGTGPDNVWFVGSGGLALHFDGTSLQLASVDVRTSLFTVDVDDEGALAVGGVGRGVSFSYAAGANAWQEVTPDGDQTPALFGVHRRDGEGYAVGDGGAVYAVHGTTLVRETLPFPVSATLHACFVDDNHATWIVGGSLARTPLRNGILLRREPR